METVWYTEPCGDEIPNPTAQQMLDFMRRDYSDYWGPYSPVGVLGWHEHLPQPQLTAIGLGGKTKLCQLLFVLHPEYGWFFEYNSDREPLRWLVPLDHNHGQEQWVRHWVCGEEKYFLASCFVRQAVGEQIVLHFLASKEVSPAIRWVEFESLRPRLELTEYRRRLREQR